MSTSSSSKECIRYRVDDSPAHFQRAGLYLKQLRERRDTRSCDVIFLLENGEQERLHSAVAGGHSSRLAKMLSTETKLPMVMDLSQYPSSSVRLVVDWMYKGTIDIYLRDLADHLVVASDLCVVFLHRQLEQTLRLQSHKKDSLVASLNIASHPSTGISASTVNDMVKIVAEQEKKGESLTVEDLRGMTLRSMMSLVAIRIKQTDKALLINVALNWLRLYPNYVDDVISTITVMEMSEADLNAFRMTLTSAMRNPNLRRNTYVCHKKDANYLAINVDAGDLSASPSLSGVSVDGSEFEEQLAGLERSRSELEEIRTLPSDSLVNRAVCGSNRPSRQLSTSSLASFTGSVASTTSTASGRPRSLTRSEMRDINNLPDIFSGDETQLAKGFVKWERKGDSTDSFPREVNNFHVRQPASTRKTAPISYTRSEVDEIRDLPDLFDKAALISVSVEMQPLPKQSSSTSTACSMSPTTLDEAREMQLKTFGKRDRSTEASEIRQLDVSFSKDQADFDANPHAVNSSYANVPKTTTSSYYAF